MRAASELLVASNKILVLSGAGLSKASGLQTYRDLGGLWEVDDNFLRYAHADQYRQDPASFTRFWRARRAEVLRAQPNQAHFALRVLQGLKPQVHLVTQNVDGLLQRAGCHNVAELHGNLLEQHCGSCGATKKLFFGRCLHCGGRVRPSVTLFGESLPEEALQTAFAVASSCDLVVVIGTSAAVYPAAELPVMALRFGAKLIVLDTAPPLLAHAADVVLTGKAEDLLPELVARVELGLR